MKKHVQVLTVLGMVTLFIFLVSGSGWLDHKDKVTTIPVDQTMEMARKESRETAKKFMQIFAPLPSKETQDAKKAVLPFVADHFYQQNLKIFQWQESGLKSLQLKSMDFYEISGGTSTDLFWNVVTIESATFKDHRKFDLEKWYWLHMVKEENGEWKVKEVRSDTDGQ